MGARNGGFRFRLLVVISAFFLLYLLFPYLIPRVFQFVDWARQTHPWSDQHQIQQKFEATETELACLNGTPLPGEDHGWQQHLSDHTHNHNDDVEPIPNIVHFTYGLKPNAGHFDFMSYLAVRSAVVSLEPDHIYLHYTYLSEPQSADPNADPLTNPWIRRLAPHITLVHHDPVPEEAGTQYAHLSDLLRLRFLQEQGGIYLDIDSFALRSFADLRRPPRQHDIVLGHEGGNRWGLCNAIMAARPNSTFVARWLASYADADLHREWNFHSVLLPKQMADAHPREVCALAPDAFFWPTWTWKHVEWMHEPIGREEAYYWQEAVRNNSGSLFPNQRAYHAWNQMAWDRHLKFLTPRVVREKDTRFNILVRRFLEDDLV